MKISKDQYGKIKEEINWLHFYEKQVFRMIERGEKENAIRWLDQAKKAIENAIEIMKN